MKKLIVLLAILAFSTVALSGCYTTGKVAGTVVQGVEDGAKDVSKGYKDGTSN